MLANPPSPPTLTSEETSSGTAAAESAVHIDSRHLAELLRKRLKRFMKLLPKVLNSGDPDAVHDLRVWSRRLQQVVVTLFPKPRPREAKDIVRALRRTRRATGGWRDCDVLIGSIDREARRLRDPDGRRGWELVRASLLRRRERKIRRARRKLADRRLFSLPQTAAKLMAQLEEGQAGDGGAETDNPGAVLANSIATAYSKWRTALTCAQQTADPADIHAFRIQTKQLRYRIELVRDLGAKEAEPALSRLKALQDGLGHWRDRGELARMTAKALAKPELLLNEPRVAALLLRRLVRERKTEEAQIRKLLARASKNAVAQQLDTWVNGYCKPPLSPASLPTQQAALEDGTE